MTSDGLPEAWKAEYLEFATVKLDQAAIRKEELLAYCRNLQYREALAFGKCEKQANTYGMRCFSDLDQAHG